MSDATYDKPSSEFSSKLFILGYCLSSFQAPNGNIHTLEMAESMDIDTPIPSPASAVQPRNAMAALMANAKGKGKEIASTSADQKAVDDKEGLPWYVLFPFFVDIPGFREVDV